MAVLDAIDARGAADLAALAARRPGNIVRRWRGVGGDEEDGLGAVLGIVNFRSEFNGEKLG
jgi:hypothetical protein